MSLVLDGSAALAWCFEDVASPLIDTLFGRIVEDGAVVPALWRLEVANGLQMGVRRKRLSAARRDQFLAAFETFDIQTDPETERYAWTTTVHLADRFQLTIYDASYLELAQRLSLPLASLDRDLRGAARAVGLELLGI